MLLLKPTDVEGRFHSTNHGSLSSLFKTLIYKSRDEIFPRIGDNEWLKQGLLSRVPAARDPPVCFRNPLVSAHFRCLSWPHPLELDPPNLQELNLNLPEQKWCRRVQSLATFRSGIPSFSFLAAVVWNFFFFNSLPHKSLLSSMIVRIFGKITNLLARDNNEISY